MPTRPDTELETFANPHPERDYWIRIEAPEFTCLCPRTGQPDFATVHVDYVPHARCVELKSLKLYLWSFREKGAFHEAVTNEILDTLRALLAPRFVRVRLVFAVRGGIHTTVLAEHREPDWQPAPALEPPATR